jgi:hypothetical protein
MKILKTTAAAVISSFLMGGACIPAWSAPTSQGLTVAQATIPKTTVGSASTVLGSPDVPRFDSRPDAEKNCKPGQMYSAHDIVGHPQAHHRRRQWFWRRPLYGWWGACALANSSQECTAMVPSLTVVPMDSCSIATATTGSTRVDCWESIAQRWRCLRNVDERA